jgi:hypothetical protein
LSQHFREKYLAAVSFFSFFFNWCSFYLKEKPHCLCT